MITVETIDRITGFDGGALPVVSVYLGLDPDRRDLRSLPSRASSLLHDIRPLTKDESLDREARLSVRGDIERIESAMTEERVRSGAVAIFSCSGRNFYEEIELPRRVFDRVVVDGSPWVRPMLTVLDEYHRACVVIVDKETARTWELYQDQITQTQQVMDQALRKTDYAGWSGWQEQNVRNRDGELTKKHFRNVAAVLDDLYRAGRFELLVIGGHEQETAAFLGYLPHNLRGSVAGTFAIDPNAATIGDVRASAEAILEQYERDEEQRSVATPRSASSAACGPARRTRSSGCWSRTMSRCRASSATSRGGSPRAATPASSAAVRPARPTTSSTSWPRR
jgi:hypothetical protein